MHAKGTPRQGHPGVDAVCDVRCGVKCQVEVRLNLSLKAAPSDSNSIKLIQEIISFRTVMQMTPCKVKPGHKRKYDNQENVQWAAFLQREVERYCIFSLLVYAE